MEVKKCPTCAHGPKGWGTDPCRRCNNGEHWIAAGSFIAGEKIMAGTIIMDDPCAKPEPKNPFDTQVGGTHYQKFPAMQPAEFLERNKVPFTEGNIVKYVLRHSDKNGLEDLRKAAQYLEFLAFCTYGENI